MKDIQVVSLMNSTDRRQGIAADFGRLDLDFDFFDAIDGRTEFETYRHLTNLDISEKILGRRITLGEIGCALSHRQLLQEFVQRTTKPFVFVFEDDVRLDPRAKIAMQALAHDHAHAGELIVFPSGYDFHPRWRSAKALVGEIKLYRNIDATWGTYGMFITRPVAERLLDDCEPIVVPADYVGRVYGRHRLEVLGVWPPVLFHPHFEQYPHLSQLGAERADGETVPARPSLASTWISKLSTTLRQWC